MAVQAFWSYAHKDNKNTDGIVRQIAESLMKEFELQSGEPLLLFIDRGDLQGIKWGEAWRAVIDSRLNEAAFFIPVLSPAYFSSAECRREFQDFLDAADQAGEVRWVLPLRLVTFERAEDPLTQKATGLQICDWTRLRILGPGSAEWRDEISQMAERLLSVQKDADAATSPPPSRPASNEEPTATSASPATPAVQEESTNVDEGLGSFDLIAQAEQIADDLRPLLEQMTVSMNRVNVAFRDAVPDIGKASSFQERLRVLRRVAAQVQAPALDFAHCAEEYATSIARADPGIRALLAHLDLHGTDEQSIQDLKTTLRTFTDITLDLADNAETFIETVRPLEGQSRDLRPLLKKMRLASSQVVSTRSVFQGWRELTS